MILKRLYARLRRRVEPVQVQTQASHVRVLTQTESRHHRGVNA